MKYYIIAILVLFISFIVLTQLNTLPDKWQEYSDQIDADFKGYEMLEDLCINIGGRIAGSENGKKAEQLVIDYLKSFGYKNILLHEFDHIGWQRQLCDLSINEFRE